MQEANRSQSVVVVRVGDAADRWKRGSAASRRLICGGWKSLSFAAFALLACSASAADTYTLDSVHSIPTFEFKHLGVTTQSGRFDKATGSVTLDLERKTGSVSYEVDSGSLNMGYGTETPESPGYRLFEVTKFPKVVFRSNTLLFNAQKEVVGAIGKLTLLGVTKPLSILVSGFKCSVNPVNKKDMCVGEVNAYLKRSDFGMNAYIPGISDEIKVSVPIEAYKN